MEGIIASVITSVLALVGVIITNARSNQAIETKLEIAQAVTDEKLDKLTEEVRKHNNFASRVPVIEKELEHLNKEMEEVKEKIG
jgi:hypothetical protein